MKPIQAEFGLSMEPAIRSVRKHLIAARWHLGSNGGATEVAEASNRLRAARSALARNSTIPASFQH